MGESAKEPPEGSAITMEMTMEPILNHIEAALAAVKTEQSRRSDAGVEALTVVSLQLELAMKTLALVPTPAEVTLESAPATPAASPAESTAESTASPIDPKDAVDLEGAIADWLQDAGDEELMQAHEDVADHLSLASDLLMDRGIGKIDAKVRKKFDSEVGRLSRLSEGGTLRSNTHQSKEALARLLERLSPRRCSKHNHPYKLTESVNGTFWGCPSFSKYEKGSENFCRGRKGYQDLLPEEEAFLEGVEGAKAKLLERYRIDPLFADDRRA